jgi:phosphoribosylformimino-5-aminoimidazole carboxamide ribotide isomerase
MKIMPAIDLMSGACVRLRQGDYERVTRYADDPVALARGYEAAGADALHVVDLDGARDGRGANTEAIDGICRAVAIPVQTGGGLRSGDNLRALFDLGVHRAVVDFVCEKRWPLRLFAFHPHALYDVALQKPASDGVA